MAMGKSRFGARICGRPQQRLDLIGLGAELGGQIETGCFMVNRHARKNDGLAGVDFGQQGLQAAGIVDNKMPDAVFLLCDAGCVSDPDRVHQVADGVLTECANLLDLDERGAVEVPNTCVQQSPEDERMVVCFDGIQDATREAFDEALGRSAVNQRIDAVHRVVRLQCPQHLRHIAKTEHECGSLQ